MAKWLGADPRRHRTRRRREWKKGFWTRIGVAFQNRDQSWNLRFDFIPTRLGETTIQLRPFDARPEGDATDPEPAPSRRPALEPATPLAHASDAVDILGGRSVIPNGRHFLFVGRRTTRRPRVSGGDADFAVIIAMSVARVMQMTADEIVHMIPVRHRLMAASCPMLVSTTVRCTSVVWRAFARICAANVELMFDHVTLVRMVQMAVVQIVEVTIVLDSFVAAARSMNV